MRKCTARCCRVDLRMCKRYAWSVAALGWAWLLRRPVKYFNYLWPAEPLQPPCPPMHPSCSHLAPVAESASWQWV